MSTVSTEHTTAKAAKSFEEERNLAERRLKEAELLLEQAIAEFERRAAGCREVGTAPEPFIYAAEWLRVKVKGCPKCVAGEVEVFDEEGRGPTGLQACPDCSPTETKPVDIEEVVSAVRNAHSFTSRLTGGLRYSPDAAKRIRKQLAHALSILTKAEPMEVCTCGTKSPRKSLQHGQHCPLYGYEAGEKR